MKHLIHGFISIIIVMLFLLIITTISAKSTRKKEINSSLTSSLDQAIENVMIKNTYTINNVDEFVADVIEELLSCIENDSTIEIKIANADLEKGIISLKAIQTYENPNGTESKYEVNKTVVMEESDSVRYSVITYYDEFENAKKRYTVINGDTCPYYQGLIAAGKTFKTWGLKNIDGSITEMSETEIQNIVVTQNLNFIPIWN